jgi:hypothetical protein
MSEFSNPLKRGLRQMPAAGGVPHPDADLLTAFTEQSLTKREREEVLAHLASCADCRDVIALALPEASLSRPIEDPVKPLFWRWPVLRWGAVAASVVIVAVAVSIGNIEHNRSVQKLAQSRSDAASPISVPPAATVQREQTGLIASNKLEEPRMQVSGSSGVQRPKVRYERIPGDSAKTALSLPAKENADKFEVGTVDQHASNVAVGKIVAGVVEPSAQPPAAVDETVNSTIFKRDAGTYSATARMKAAVPAPPPPPLQSATETVEVSSAAVQVESAKSAPAVEKPETQLADAGQSLELESGAAKKQIMRFAAATNWRISNGFLQRSFDSGQTWEQARPDANFRTVSTIGNEIWAGGANSLLVHSTNAGQTWAVVSPGMKGDVTSLQFNDAKHGVVKTSTGEIWVTTDGGKSWTKQ